MSTVLTRPIPWAFMTGAREREKGGGGMTVYTYSTPWMGLIENEREGKKKLKV